MPGRHLTIDDYEPPAIELSSQIRQRHFRSVAAAAEHRFTVKDASERDAVQTANELVALPGLDRMREAKLRETRIGGHHVGGNPRAVLLRPRRRTPLHHRLECPIERDRESGRPDRATQ